MSFGKGSRPDLSERNFRHGMSGTPEHKAWNALRRRCYDKKSKDWPLYGGKGVSVCDRWLGDGGFVNFFKDMGPKPSPKHQIERKDSNRNYTPDNCKWATPTEQSRNTSRNRRITFQGKTLTLIEWEIETGIKNELIRARVDRCGWSVEKALTTPTDERRTGRYGVRRKVRRQ